MIDWLAQPQVVPRWWLILSSIVSTWLGIILLWRFLDQVRDLRKK